MALAKRRATEQAQLESDAIALASDFAELERERLEIDSEGDTSEEAASAAAGESAARADLARAERQLANAAAESQRIEVAFSAVQRDVRAYEEDVERAATAFEQARLVADLAARAAVEEEAERRAREGALRRELGELAVALASAEQMVVVAGAQAQEHAAELAAAEIAFGQAQRVRQQAAEALIAARAEATAHAQKLESVERNRADAGARRDEAELVLAELRQRLGRLEGDLAHARASDLSDPAGLMQLEAEFADAEVGSQQREGRTRQP